MPRKLVIVRHAKSDWSAPGLSDHDRPLNERGRAAAPQVGKWLDEQGIRPDLVLCSSAARTQQTLQGLQDGGLEIGTTKILQDLYLASMSTTNKLVEAYAEDHDTIMIVGHNPTSHELAMHLALKGTDDTPDKRRSEMASKFPTGAVAIFDLETDWSDITSTQAALTHFIVPRELA